LASPGGAEAQFRTAINRAYYAAYLTSIVKLRGSWALAQAKGETDSYHEQIRRAFVHLQKPNISDKLADLFDQRVIADYYPDETMGRSSARNGVDLGTDIVELIEADP
jgi:hypothetical protein